MITALVPKFMKRRTYDEIRSDIDSQYRDIGRVVAGRFTRGSTSMQNRTFLSQYDLDEMRRERDERLSFTKTKS